MKHRYRLPFALSAAGALALAVATAHAEEAQDGASAEEPHYMPLLLDRQPLASPWQSDERGALQLGLDYTSDDNFMFGQYNGLHEKGTTLIGELRWQDFGGDSYWRADVSNLGLDTREGSVTWGRGDRFRVQLGFDSQLQVRNDSGRSPFRGDSDLSLPGEWVSAATTGDFSAFDATARGVTQELDREKLSLGIDYRFSDSWQLDSHLSYEDRSGTRISGAGIYLDAATADAVLLPEAVDYSTTEFDLGLAYSGDSLYLKGVFDYSDFDNKDDLQTWQNPYSGYGPAVRYPAGIGGLGVAPDNEQMRGRITGHYITSPTSRLQFDGSYAVLSQDQDFVDFTINPALSQAELPRGDLDGEVAIGTLNVALLLQITPRWNVKAYFDARDRDYDTPRDGYLYSRGDAGNEPRQALAVYNTAHDYLSQTLGIDLDVRLPLRSRLSFDYAFEMVDRENAAVEETEEDRYTLAYRIQPWSNFTARLEASYGDRQADTYEWGQRYYALLDVNLINATPDNQRFINHPDLSQYHLSNRERSEAKADFTWQPGDRWQLNANFLWREDDFDKTELGLNDSEWQRAQFSASYAATDAVNATLYGGFDRYESAQTGRAFRGGQEKNPFEGYPPQPQGSDPRRNWNLDARDEATTLGANLQWQLSESLVLAADYNFVDTESRQQLASVGLAVDDLPDVETRLHHFTGSGTWHISEQLSLRLDYLYYRYTGDDYTYTGSAASIDKVLTLGARNPNEQIHYVGASAIYRWK